MSSQLPAPSSKADKACETSQNLWQEFDDHSLSFRSVVIDGELCSSNFDYVGANEDVYQTVGKLRFIGMHIASVVLG